MKLNIEIDLGLSNAKKWSMHLGVPFVLVIAGGVAFAGLPGGYADGQPLTAEALTSNFDYLQNEIAGADGGGGLQGQVSALQDTVAAKYQLASGETLPNAPAVIVYSSMVYDTNSAYSTSGAGAGYFTCPTTGIYAITASIRVSNSTSSTTNSGFYLYVYTGLSTSSMSQSDMLGQYAYSATGVGVGFGITGSARVRCQAGNLIGVYAWKDSTVTVGALSTVAFDNFIAIERVGN